MTSLNVLSAAAILSLMFTTPVFAQAAFSEPAAFQAMFPNRDVLNGGSLTPAGRMDLELAGGAASVSAENNAYARMDSASPTFCAQRYRSYDPVSGTFLGYDGHRHQCD
jgi:BA14K-like protein